MKFSAGIGGIYDFRQMFRNRRELRLPVNLDVCLSPRHVFDLIAAVVHCTLIALQLALQCFRAGVVRVQHKQLQILTVRETLIDICSATTVVLHIQLAKIMLLRKCVQYRTVLRRRISDFGLFRFRLRLVVLFFRNVSAFFVGISDKLSPDIACILEVLQEGLFQFCAQP